MSRSTHSRLQILVAALVVWWTPQTVSAQQQSPRIALIIHWGSEAFPGTHVTDAAIREALQSGADPPVNCYSQFLETEEVESETASVALRDYILRTFQGRQIDVVVTVATPALQFALSHQDELFPHVPIVFLAGSVPDVVNHKHVGVTGLLSDAVFAPTLELALRLHPAVKQVFVVAQAPTATGYDERIRTALAPFAQRVEMTYIRERSLRALLAAVQAVPAGSLIFYARYAPEQTERILYPDEVARRMAEVSSVPIYGVADLYLGTGVVGGIVRGTLTNGHRLGEIARLVLNGIPADSIPIKDATLTPMFDWRQVLRWGIDPSKLPPGSELRFKTPTAWESYRAYIIGAVVLVAGQLVLIAGLLTERTRRRRVEGTVRAREASLRVSYERIRQLAGTLINAQEVARAKLARDLHDSVCQDLSAIAISIGNLKRSSGCQDAQTLLALSKLQAETESTVDGVRRMSHDLHPATLRLLGLGSALRMHCREFAERYGLQVAFTVEGLDNVQPDVEVALFRIAQESLQNVAAHSQASKATVSLVRCGDQIELTVADNGRGFDLDSVRLSGSGLGLVSIEERAIGIGGGVQVLTGPQAGTTIRIRCGPDGIGASSSPSEGSVRNLGERKREQLQSHNRSSSSDASV